MITCKMQVDLDVTACQMLKMGKQQFNSTCPQIYMWSLQQSKLTGNYVNVHNNLVTKNSLFFGFFLLQKQKANRNITELSLLMMYTAYNSYILCINLSLQLQCSVTQARPLAWLSRAVHGLLVIFSCSQCSKWQASG